MKQAQTIAQYQSLLQSIAMRILRSKADAEDIVQDTYLKWLSMETGDILNVKAYLVKSVTNNCINHLEALKRKKEEYLENVKFSDLLNRFKELDFSHIDINVDVHAALNVIHHKLEPLERAVFLLREVFNFDYEALQEVLDKKKDHCRQLFSRAKKKLDSEASKLNVDWSISSQWIETFKKACEMGVPGDFIKTLKGELNVVSS